MDRLSEVCEKVKDKSESIKNDPAVDEVMKSIMEKMVIIFYNGDAILQCPKSIIKRTLRYVGYPYEELETIYNELVKELKTEYYLIDPDLYKKWLEERD